MVVGSGYGGAILAARLAGPGRSVCVLERGREWRPGDFPTTAIRAAEATRSVLNPLGLIDAHTNPSASLDVVVGCGVGGTSLLNAAIALRPEPLVLQRPEWPSAIRSEASSGALAAYYARAEAVLQPGSGPNTLSAVKVAQHKQGVAARGKQHALLHLNIAQTARPSAAGVRQPACTSCGDCCSGCNLGAKNSLDFNYLPLARGRGAQTFAGFEVKKIEKLPSGRWKVSYEQHKPGLNKHASIEANVVVLSAGTLGTAGILLRSQAAGLPLARAIGSRFSANGDVMGLSYNGPLRTDIIGLGLHPRSPRGPALASFGDYRSGDLLDRFLLIEGTIPTPLVGTVGKALALFAEARLLGHFDKDAKARMKRDLLGRVGEDGALNHSLIYFACGHDTASGKLALGGLGGESVVVHWPGIAQERFIGVINAEMAAHAKVHGGHYVPDPRSSKIGGDRIVTTHPLGGCPMGDTPDSGTVDDRGRVYDGRERAPRAPGGGRLDRAALAGRDAAAHHLGAGRADRREAAA